MSKNDKLQKKITSEIAGFLALFTISSISIIFLGNYLFLILLFPAIGLYYALKLDEKISFRALLQSLFLSGFMIILLGGGMLVVNYTTKPWFNTKELSLFIMVVGAIVCLAGYIYRICMKSRP